MLVYQRVIWLETEYYSGEHSNKMQKEHSKQKPIQLGFYEIEQKWPAARNGWLGFFVIGFTTLFEHLFTSQFSMFESQFEYLGQSIAEWFIPVGPWYWLVNRYPDDILLTAGYNAPQLKKTS